MIPLAPKHLAVLSLLALVGCAERAWEITDGRAGATVGEIEMEDHPSGDGMVTVALDELPPLQEGGGYVVWLRPMGMHTLKAGELAYYPRARRGMMRMVTPYESFELLVTAERKPGEAVRPAGPVVGRRVVQPD